jgi:hypothetical protein
VEHGGREALDEGVLGEWKPEEDVGGGGGGVLSSTTTSATATREPAQNLELENAPSAETKGLPGTTRGRAGRETSGGGHRSERRHPAHPFKDIVAEQGRHAHLLDREWNPYSKQWTGDPGNRGPNGEYIDDQKYWVRIRGNAIVETRTGWLGHSHLEVGPYELNTVDPQLEKAMVSTLDPDLVSSVCFQVSTRNAATSRNACSALTRSSTTPWRDTSCRT